MQFRRVLSVMLMMLMLASIMPTATAMTYWCPDEGLEHDWGPVDWMANNGCGTQWGFRTCRRCGAGEEVTREIPHTWGPWEDNGATCGMEGYRWRECSNCGLIEEEVYYVDHVPGKWYPDPAYGPATCTEGTIEICDCKVCGEKGIDEREVGPAGHKWGPWETESTGNCVERGTEIRECTVCGEQEFRNADFGGHIWGAWIVVETGDCTHPGTEKRVCSVCEKVEFRDTEEGSHEWSGWYVGKEADCTENGAEVRKCARCGKEETREVEKLGHKWGKWVVIQEAGDGQVGIRERKCSRCGLTEREEFYPEGTIKKGDEGDRVEELQDKLNELGYSCGTADGVFGNKTEKALEEWQEDHGYIADGIGWPGQIEELIGNDSDGTNFKYVTVEKSITSTPANGEYYVLGETISFLIKVVIPEGKTINDLEITDPLKGINEDMVLDILPIATSADNTEYTFNYVVKAEDVERGYVINSACAYFFDPEGDAWVEEWSEDVIAPTGDAAQDYSIILAKYITSTPANGKYYVPGETVAFMITVENASDKTFNNVIVYDPILEFAELKLYDVIEPGFKDKIVFEYVVTNEDADAGFVENTAFVVRPDGADFQDRIYSNNVIAPCGYDIPEYVYFEYVITGDLKVTKSVISQPANGQFYLPGETVTFQIDVTNNHPTMAMLDVVVTDPLMFDLGGDWACMYIDPGMTESFTFDYIVTPIDAIAGSFSNVATANAFIATGDPSNPKGEKHVGISNTVVVPTGMADDFPFGVITEMTIVKEETSTPANGIYYTEGETISYKITYTNTGETDFGETLIYDTLANGDEIASAEMLHSGESRYCTFDYVVTAADVEKGYVANTAIAKFDIGAGYINTATSNVVISDTDGDPNTTYVPGSGTIDWEKLRGTKDAVQDTCYVRVISRDGDSIEYETHFCSKHAMTHESILMMAEAAGDTSMQMVWEYAYVLWQKDIAAMYDEILAASDDDAKITVMGERVTHLAMLANTQYALKIAEPGQPEKTAEAVANLWQDKCIDMCYLMNTAPSARVDSIFNVEPEQNASVVTESCTCTVVEEAGDKIISADEYCMVHRFTYQMMEVLIKNDNSLEAWQTVRDLWYIELTAAYNRLYRDASAEGGMAYLAEFAAYTKWLPAYEGFLTMVYPENPEIVAEVMVNIIMERALDACNR